ncbi:MAG: 30S ribosomal protein S8 [Opitutaceae bacterium]|nr:30S ribosomal protein S8 [Verrucomicrobiales bacterium]
MSALTDPIADFLTRLRNGSRARKGEILIPYSKIKAEMARILKKEGFITDFGVDTSGPHPQLKVVTRTVNKTTAITDLKRVSRPGLRRYVAAQEIPRVLGGLGISILSTSQGILSGTEARKKKVGGELLAFVW